MFTKLPIGSQFEQIDKARWSKKLFKKDPKLNFMRWQFHASFLMNDI